MNNSSNSFVWVTSKQGAKKKQSRLSSEGDAGFFLLLNDSMLNTWNIYAWLFAKSNFVHQKNSCELTRFSFMNISKKRNWPYRLFDFFSVFY